jgi:hypothetical protein
MARVLRAEVLLTSEDPIPKSSSSKTLRYCMPPQSLRRVSAQASPKRQMSLLHGETLTASGQRTGARRNSICELPDDSDQEFLTDVRAEG